ncbi:MAG TPA: hypothetical protein VFB45_25665 [Pseudolabrys sp.]|nr:hypothetical protein [Pseudolabrys sp.]
MLPLTAIIPLALFMAILLAAALCALAASGHFPREHRPASLTTPLGAGILHGSMALCVLSVVAGVALIAPIVPWYAAVIGGGAVILATPPLLQPLPDHFVNGRGALLTFAGTSALMAALLNLVAG